MFYKSNTPLRYRQVYRTLAPVRETRLRSARDGVRRQRITQLQLSAVCSSSNIVHVRTSPVNHYRLMP